MSKLVQKTDMFQGCFFSTPHCLLEVFLTARVMKQVCHVGCSAWWSTE